MDKTSKLSLLSKLSVEELEDLLKSKRAKEAKVSRQRKISTRVHITHRRTCRLCGSVSTEFYTALRYAKPDAVVEQEIVEDVLICSKCVDALTCMEKPEIVGRALKVIAFLAPSQRTPDMPKTTNCILGLTNEG